MALPFQKKKSKNPIKKHPALEVEESDEDEEEIEEEDEDLMDEGLDDLEEEVEEAKKIKGKETPLPTNEEKYISGEFDRVRAELELETSLRKLYEIERQLKTRKISIKNDNQLTGIMSEQEMLILASELKYEITLLIDIMKKKFKMKDKYFVEQFKIVEKGMSGYEFWVATSKK